MNAALPVARPLAFDDPAVTQLRADLALVEPVSHRRVARTECPEQSSRFLLTFDRRHL